MKRKTKVSFIITSCFAVLLIISLILIRNFEESVHYSISGGIFIIGVLLGMVYAYILSLVDSHI